MEEKLSGMSISQEQETANRTISVFAAEAPEHRAACPCAWNDSWFADENDGFNTSLAATSMALSAAAYGNTAQNGYAFISDALCALGFADIDVSAYEHRTGADDTAYTSEEDLVAYALGHRTLQLADAQSELVVMVMRGAECRAEYASNVNFANSVDDGNYNVEYHEGFDAAADEAYGHCMRYLEERGIAAASARVLMVGHGRGGAVANLLAAFMVESGDFDARHVFAYTFGAPCVTRRKDAASDAFAGIHNVVDPQDWMSRYVLEAWGFTRFGEVLCLPAETDVPAHSEAFSKAARALFKEFTGAERASFSSLGPVLAMERQAAALCPALSVAYEHRRPTKLGTTTYAALARQVADMMASSGARFAVDAAKVGRFAAGPFWPLLKNFAKGEVTRHAGEGAHCSLGYLARLAAAAQAGLNLQDITRSTRICFTTYGDVDVTVKDAAGRTCASVWKGSVEKAKGEATAFPAFWEADVQAARIWMDRETYQGSFIELRDRGGRSFGVTVAEQDMFGHTRSQDEYGPLKIGAGHTFAWSALMRDAPCHHAARGNNLSVRVRTEGGKHCDAVGAAGLTAGDWTVVRAYEGRGATFKGWFVEGRNPQVAKPESTSHAYRTRVAESKTLIAVFGR